MDGAVKRVVRLGSMAYIDPSGRARWADCGDEVGVHPDYVDRFDRLNVLQTSESTSTPAPVAEGDVQQADQAPAPESARRRPGRRKADAED